MRFKFILALALILCAFCVLPVSADIYDTPIHILRTGEPITVTNTDTVYLSVLLPYLSGFTVMPPELVINGQELTSNEIYCSIPSSVSTIALGSFIDGQNNIMPIYVLHNPNKLSQITIHTQWKQLGGTQSQGFDQVINFVFNDEYLDYLDSAQINANVDHYTDNTVTYNLQCISDYPNAVLYSSIAGYRDFSLGLIQYNETETITEITTGLDNIIVYAWAYNTYNTDIKLLELELQGRNEFIPIEPTVSPTDIPIYPDRIQAFIQTFDYQNGNMLSGVNMSVYEVIENGDNLQIGNKIYSSINADSQTILTVKNNTEYFIENELSGYFAVKNENIASLNNRNGYLWNPTLINPLRLYYSRLDPTAQYNANFIVQDVNNNGIAGVSVTMDNSITKISNSIGGLTFNNVSAGTHTFTFVKNGYQSAQRTIDIQLQYAAFTQTLFKDDQIIQPTVSPTAYPTTYPTVSPTAQPTLSPIDKPSNIMESVSFGFAKIFGIKTVENANYIFALMLILFPAVVAGGITHQALGFIAGGMIGFVFALAVGLVPIWVFFAMCLLAVIYFVLKGGNEGF